MQRRVHAESSSIFSIPEVPRIAQGDEAAEHEAAAGGIAGEDDARGRDAAILQPLMGGHDVVDRRGKGMLGGESVVEGEDPHPGGHAMCAIRD